MAWVPLACFFKDFSETFIPMWATTPFVFELYIYIYIICKCLKTIIFIMILFFFYFTILLNFFSINNCIFS